MERFQYTDEISGDEIRVLVLQPASSIDATIECQLEVHSRQDCPSYEALSYCWGPPELATDIRLHEALFAIGEGLSSALYQLRLPNAKRHLWIDAICINQASESEKSAQVGRMGETYGRCHQTLAWLGPASKSSALAVDAIRTIGGQFVGMGMVQVAESQRPLPPMISGSDIDTYLRAIRRLLQRPWFTRLWVVQEVCLAPQVQFICGDETFEMIHLTNMERSMLSSPDIQSLTDTSGVRKVDPRAGRSNLIQLFDMQLGLTRFLFQATPEEVPDIVEMKEQHCALLTHIIHWPRRRCTVAKDRIYALLSLSLDVRDKIKPDYAEPLFDTYAKVCKAIIFKYRNLNALCLCRDPEPLSAQAHSRPSWVPDFDTGINDKVAGGTVHISTNYIPGGERWFTATADSSFDADPSDHASELTVSGYDLCVVCDTSPLKLKDGFERAWELMQSRVGHAEDSTARTKEIFWRTVITNRQPDSSLAREDVEGHEFNQCWDAATSGGADMKSLLPAFSNYNTAYWQHGAKRTFFTTSTGLVGLAHPGIETGDHVCLLAGAQTPFILRCHGENFQVVSEAYVHGIMYGEQWNELERAGVERRQFVLV